MTALVLATYGTVCHLCLRGGATTRDHIIPKSKGGPDSVENCRPAHHRCNSRRQDRPLTAALLAEFRPNIRDISVDVTELFEDLDARKPRDSVHFLPDVPQKKTGS